MRLPPGPAGPLPPRMYARAPASTFFWLLSPVPKSPAVPTGEMKQRAGASVLSRPQNFKPRRVCARLVDMQNDRCWRLHANKVSHESAPSAQMRREDVPFPGGGCVVNEPLRMRVQSRLDEARPTA